MNLTSGQQTIRTLFFLATLVFGAAVRSYAQAPGGANTGALTFSGGIDVPSVYFFRGMRQEGEPKLTLQPYGDLAVRFGDRIRATVGIWNSLHTGTSGTGGPTTELHYEERFYSSLTVDLPSRLSLGTSYIAYTSPNGSFPTVKEMDVKLGENGRFSPYALVAFELSDLGQADGGLKKGTYLELGASPQFSFLGHGLTLSVPITAGFSLKNYYELIGSSGTTTDHSFGFLGIGGTVALPITTFPPRFGSWDIHGGVEFLTLGDTTKAFNKGDKNQAIARVGVGVKY